MTAVTDTATGVTHEVVLSTSDGVESTLVCPPDLSILEAAADAGTYLPSMCGQGTCGACAAHVSAGSYVLGEHDPSVLGSDPTEGTVLLCRTTPTADCRVELPYDRTRIVDSPPPVRRATVTAIDVVAEATVRLRLGLVADELGMAAEFDPGQFLQVQVPGTEELRAYSLANCGNWDGEFELFVRVQPGGLFSTWLTTTAAVGDVVTVHGPRGAFGLRENGLRPRWFVGGGTGLAPMLSMMRRMAEWGEAQPARLYFGVNTVAEVFAQDEIAEVVAALPDAAATTCVWHPEPGASWDGFVGTPVDALVRDLAGSGEPPDVYVCGPPAMVDAVERALAAAGIPAEQVRAERFTAS